MLERVWRKGNPLTLLVGMQWRFSTVWRFLKKLEIELPYDPAIPLLGIHTEETRSERDTCTPMFIAVLGKTQRDRVEREVGGGIGMGNTCKSMADSCQCMTKLTTIL